MSTETTAATKLPEVLVLAGATYRISENPELQAFVDSIVKHTATTEKSKLYGQINSFKERVEGLEKAALIASQNAPSIDYGKIEEMINAKLSATEAVLATKFTDLMKPIAQHVETQVTEDVNAYKNRLITENTGKCMVELIQGNTKAELDSTLANALELAKKYPVSPPVITVNQPATTPAATTTPATTQPVTQAAPATTNTTATPVADMPVPPANPVVTTKSTPDLKAMTDKDFAKNRENLLADITAQLNK